MVGRATPRPVSWWIAVGLLLLAWWFPLSAGAQGLRSTSAAVTLSVTRLPDAPRQVRDIPVEVGAAGDSSLAVHLVSGPVGSLYVRDAAGRLVALGTDPVAVRGPLLLFRLVDPERLAPDASWDVSLAQAGSTARRLEVRARQLR